ncbi:MAG: hypothetical protein ACI4EK_03015 [Wujia sp.]
MTDTNPFYVPRIRTPELMLVDEQELEEDREYLRTMYPMRAKMILVMVEEACDKLEYEGSPMFMLYPDRVEMMRIAQEIFDKVSYTDTDDTLLHMIQVMVCHEFYIRRCRYKKRRRYF